MQKLMRKILRVVADHDPDYYDMYADHNEAFFAQFYVSRMTEHLERCGIRPPATLLEAGCQAGRLVIPLAKLGYRVTGIDTSSYALRRAREHAKAAGMKAEFVRGDLVRVLQGQPQRRYDAVVCAEVVYLSRRYGEMMQALAGAVRPGGLLFVSHRPRFYYLLEALRQYDLETAAHVLRHQEGSFRGSSYYNWQTVAELRSLYESLGLRWVAAHPVDRLAWQSGINPQQLTAPQREQLRELELQLADEGGEPVARYVLVVAAAPGGNDRS